MVLAKKNHVMILVKKIMAAALLPAVGSFLFIPFIARSSEDAVNQQALQQTQNLLKNREERQKALKANPQAQAAGEQARQVLGNSPENQDEFYALAAQVFGSLAHKYKNDGKKMAEDIEKFRQNPEAFMSSWTPEEQAKLKALADKVSRIPTNNSR